MRGVVPLMARCMAAHRDTPQLMRYYWDTIDTCAHPTLILSAMRESGLADVDRHVDLGIFSTYCGTKPL
jgi:demethylmenaquinone methyltransferase/2-methoxy-6-polyprenyl-1,4-benzoquinol methylase